jgi:short-subunit dehydrogenase
MKTVLITGAGRGIGYKLAEEFVSNGYKVIGTVRSEESRSGVLALADKLNSHINVHLLELSDFNAIDDFSKKLNGIAIDILVNCAGVLGGNHQTYDDLDFCEWERTLKVNTLSPMKLTTSMLPNLFLSEGAKVINISSIMGSLARERSDSIAYRSSKSALNKAMQCLAIELKPKNIGVYLMHPGWVRTDMGGPNADISVEESSAGLFKMISEFGLRESGRFWQYDGQELDW